MCLPVPYSYSDVVFHFNPDPDMNLFQGVIWSSFHFSFSLSKGIFGVSLLYQETHCCHHSLLQLE